MHRLDRGLISSTRSLTYVIKGILVIALLITACVLAFYDGPRDSVGTSVLFAILIALPAVVYALGVRTTVGVVVVGALLLAVDFRIWIMIRDVPIGEEFGAGFGALAAVGWGMAIALTGVGADWVSRVVFRNRGTAGKALRHRG